MYDEALPDYQIIYNFIKAKGLKVHYVADQIGVSHAHLLKVLNGKLALTKTTRIALCAKLKISEKFFARVVINKRQSQAS